MNIEIVGTGAIYSKHNSACTLINNDMIVDFPNGILKQLLKTNHNLEQIDKMLITHFHGDHTADIPFLLMYKLKKGIIKPTTIIGPIGLENKVKQLFCAYDYEFEKVEKLVEFIELNPKDIKDVGYKIEAVEVIHKKEKPASGYIVDEKIGFTGDSSLCDGAEYIIKNSGNIIITDCSHIEGNIAHLGIDNLSYLIKKYNKKLVATHIRDNTREVLEKIELENLLLVDDGTKLKI